MRTTLKTLAAACAGTLLLGCANLGHHAAPPAPVPAYAAGSADDAYVIGRQLHLAGRHQPAGASYQAALRANPQHVNARNGLATLFAEQGEYGKAIAIWQELTSSATGADGPQSAFLHNNLGYAHLLAGDFERARASLERACVLDPLNHRAWRHLGNALEKLGQHERAQLMHRQAGTLESHQFRADYALAQRTGTAAIDKAVAAGPAPDGWAVSEVRQTASGMFELHRVSAPALAHSAAPVPVAAAALATPLATPALGPKLEIRNGNGVTGMARRLARTMGETEGKGGVRVVRLTNQKGFGVLHTRVEHHPDFRAAATRLAERFGAASVVEVADCKAADMRLVIGRDLVRAKVALRPARPALAAGAVKSGPGQNG